MNNLHLVAWILVMVGALNWGLVGIGSFLGGDWNVVALILGSWPQVEALVYVLVGGAAVYEVISNKGNCKNCSAGGM